MEPLTFECLWGQHTGEAVDKVKDLWRRYRALDREDQIERRITEVVFILRDGSGEVGGVSTARPVQAKFLNNNFFYEFRCFIAPPFRAPGLDSLLAAKTRTFLENLPESPSKFKGMLMIIENEALKAQRTKAVWPATNMVFVGYTKQGHHLRVSYFKGARI